jgi:hypothetical protein
VDQKQKTLESEMGVNRFKLIVGQPFKGQVDTFEMDKYGFGKVRTFQEYLNFAGVTFVEGRNDSMSCHQLHWVPYSDPTEVEEIMGHSWKMLPKATPSPNGALDPEAEDLLEKAGKPNLQANKPGDGMRFRQEDPLDAVGGPQLSGGSMFVLVLVVGVLFVTFSNDNFSRGIRRQFRSKAETQAAL